MTPRQHTASTLLLGLAAISQAGYTDCGQILEDPGFDLWCGDRLCSWRVERGEVAAVPTWHRGDDGVALIGDDVAIYQMTGVTSRDTDCIRFEAVTDIEETAEVTLELDAYGDGSVEVSERLPTARWAPVSFRVRLATPYQGVRFRLHKRGPGRAVLAQIEATTSEDCPDGATAIAPRPDGAWCGQDDDCASSRCGGEAPALEPQPVCGACKTSDDCAAGEVCGVASESSPDLEAYRACGAPARHQLGERCVIDAECATGLCEQGACSTCRAGDTCAGGAACERRLGPGFPGLEGLAWWPTQPWQCGPEQGGAGPGEACLTDPDCAGGTCGGGGPLAVCELDGRTCDDDGDCPPLGADEPGSCVTVGTAGGSCQ